MFEIQKNVPIPESRGRHGRPNNYPFVDMEVGDSFAVAVGPEKTIASVQRQLRSVAVSFARRNASYQKYVTRALVEDGTGVVVRIWRTA